MYIECTLLQKFNGNTIDIWIFWICRKLDYPKLHKFNWKLCTLDVWIVWICMLFEFYRYVECIEVRKLNGKLCTIDVRIDWICVKFEFCGYVEYIYNCINSMGNFVH